MEATSCLVEIQKTIRNQKIRRQADPLISIWLWFIFNRERSELLTNAYQQYMIPNTIEQTEISR
jgi:hypothetical protein